MVKLCMKRLSKTLLITGVMIALAAGVRAGEALQVPVSPTPVSISLPSPIPFVGSTQVGSTTATPTRTPTSVGPAMLQAKTEANVRSAADPEAEKLGTIRAGDMYPIIGRYFRWLQFQYDQSPSGTGWVFDELVDIVGDASAIRDLSVEAAPTTDPAIQAQTETAEVITLVPGGALTATANARVISIPAPPLPGFSDNSSAATVNPEDTSESFPVGATFLPTFTYPPNIPLATPTAGQQVALAATPTEAPGSALLPTTASLPPIVPILILGALGILGLAISSFRR